MGYQALYRVWRPRKFADVVGQSHITRTLQNAISQNKFSHAYLFSGPRGTGKTSAAKIFAQTINCEQAPTEEPCNECAACRGILDGSISDVIEIDAASNTSVDDIREIRDKVKYASSSVPYKVYIIDEVHMISVNAFNALLKTLEEPPAHVVFILATTEPHKIPLTIISRCQRFDFKPIGNKTIIERLKVIVEAEGLSVANDALEAVALAAEGGMRDSLSVLDQAISYSTDRIELEDVLAVTGGVSQKVLTDIVQAMYEQDVQRTLQLFDDLIQNGKDPSRFVYDLIYFLRDVLFYKTAPALAEHLERAVLDDTFEKLTEQISVTWIQQAIVQLNECLQEIKWTNSPRVFIEIVLLTITNQYEEQHKEQQSTNVAIEPEVVERLTNRLTQLEKEIQTLQQAPKSTPVQQPRRQPPKQQTKNSYKIPYERIRPVLEGAEKSALQEVTAVWANFLTQLKSTNAPAHATIQDSKPAAASEGGLVVAFKYEIHCSLFLDNRNTVESVLGNVLGKSVTIFPIPENAWQQLRSEYINRQEESATNEEQEGNPLIDEARKLVGDDLLEIRD
ncbi:DNA polymerase III subunit gamma/tau [Virgibacillus sp. W0181]|uniref:DNA polymerase III subunit gamma/tau n=1 Tax=Virgibacillus sp. W0181 TaxID=3391581 RepID=UPI003F48F05F